MKKKLKIIIIFFSFLLSIYLISHFSQPINAISGSTGCKLDSDKGQFRGGLVTAPGGGSASSDTGVCVFGDDKVRFLPFRIPTYEDLKSIYYDQSKSKNNLTYIPGDFNAGNAGGSGIRIIFVDGNLNFTEDYTYGSGSTGTVFGVKGDVNIASNVTQVNGVLISSGTIYTAGAGCTTNSVVTAPLTINGSLIALNESRPIQFCRNLQANNATQAAETINHQVKYLVILKDLFSETLQKWGEIP